MAVGLSDKAIQALALTAKTPVIVIEVDGLATPIGSGVLFTIVRIGEYDLEIGDPDINPLAFFIGQGFAFSDQQSILNISGSSSSIKQTLNIDRGEGSSVSSLTLELQDSGFATQLITPDDLIPDIMAAKCRILIAPDQSLVWPDDFALIFRGIVSTVDAVPGKVTLGITAPESKKRSTLFKIAETKLNGSISNSAGTIALDSSANFLQKVLGPDGTYDSGFASYVQINDEIISYTSISGNSLLGCGRGQLGSVAAAHGDGDQVSSVYRLTGNPIYLALKLMLSGLSGPWVSSVKVSAFRTFESMTVANSIYFAARDVSKKYGLYIGDYITTTGAVNGANNVSLKKVIDIQEADDGSYIVVEGVAFVDESPANCVVSFRSQFDVWPEGLKMGGDEVDIDGHLTLYSRFFSSYEMDFYLKEDVNGRDFLDSQIYLPISCYSIPRQAQSSVGYHIGPIPGDRTITLDQTTLKKQNRTILKRSISRNFYNEVLYKYEKNALTDRYESGLINIAQDSKNQIAAGNKTMTIQADGLRDNLGADSIALRASSRRLKRYKFGAESLTIEALFQYGFDLEIGDIVIYDGTGDFLPDIKTGGRGISPRFFEVQNKTMDLKTGDIKLDIVDTNFSLTARYGLISMSSTVTAGASTTSFTIDPAESPLWERYENTAITVRTEDGLTIGNTVIQSIGFGVVTVSPALSFTPTAGMIMQPSNYDDPDTTTQITFKYAFMRDTAFADGTGQYLMI
jgi:hypothetical protein